jgi:hypothetical protein
LTFGQLNKWLEESDNLHIGKRSYIDEDNQGKYSSEKTIY